MNLKRIFTIIDKEWSEVFRNRMVIFTISFMPALLTVLPLVILYFLSSSSGGVSSGGSTEVPPVFLEACKDLPAKDCLQIFMMNQFMIMFMMMPLIIPVAIAAYSIVGEKTTRSLEPLLATPVTTIELLVGKALASAVPAILISWVCFIVFLVCLPVAGATQGLIHYVMGPIWISAITIIGPLMAIASVNLAVIISSRVNDPRVAEQMASVLVIPLLLVLFGQLAGVIILDIRFIFISILAIAALDIALIVVGAQLFQRETILTRWK
jgi:ABC-2 type transport system permease protein